MTAVKLPPELLSSIFLTIDFEDRRSFMITLCLVCRLWRDVIYGTPHLWSRISIVVPGPDLSQWFNKSETCPLDVTISGSAWPTAIHPTLRLIPMHLYRTRSLRICSVDKTLIYSILRPLSDARIQAPLLEEFALVDCEPANEDEFPQILAPVFDNLFHPSPHLRKLTIPDPEIHSTSTIFLHITHLTIARSLQTIPPNLNHLLDTLAAIPGLVSFKYDGLDIFSYWRVDRTTRISLPHLTTLDLTAPSSGFECLKYLDAPAVSSLRLTGARPYDYDEDWVDDGNTPVSQTLRTFAGTLVRLELVSLEHLNPDSFKWILDPAVFLQLEELRVIACPIRDDALDSNAVGKSLRRWELTGCEDVTGRALMAYIERGMSGDGPPLHLIISGCPAVSLGDFASLPDNAAIIEVL